MLKKHPSIKEVLKFWAKASFVAFTVFLTIFFAMMVVGNYARRYDQTRTYNAQGHAERYVAPDKLTISLATIVKDSTPKKVQERASEIIEATVDDIKELGLTDDEIRTDGYNIYPEYEQRRWDSDYTEQQKIIGYTMNVQIEIETKQIDKVSDILDKATSHGINSIRSMSFSIDNLEEIQDELKLEAISEAKSKANKEAKEAGLRLGKVLNVYTDNNYGYNYYDRSLPMKEYSIGNEMAGAVMDQDVPATSIPVNPGLEKVRVDVRVEYEIR